MGLMDLFRRTTPADPVLLSIPVFDAEAEGKARRTRYLHNWMIYRAEDLRGAASEDGTPSVEINLLRRNIDKVNFFAFSNGYKLVHPVYQGLLNASLQCWGANVDEKLLRVGQFGSVTGDIFLLVLPLQNGAPTVAYDQKTEKLDVKLPSKVKILLLDSSYCDPVYDAVDMDKLTAFKVAIPFLKSEMIDGNMKNTTYFQQWAMTADEIKVWETDVSGKETKTVQTYPNPIGEVSAVHIRNYPLGNSLFGLDDVRDAERLNQEITDAVTNIGQIIKYHGDPITCVYGARASNLKKGPNKIWGNLPLNGKVENLEMKGDLNAANAHVKTMKEALHVVQGVPEIAQGTQQAISNTSGVALHTMYMPLIERAVTKQLIYAPKFIDAAILTIRWMSKLDLLYQVDDNGKRKAIDGRSKDLTEEDYDRIRNETLVTFKLPLPKDELIEVQVQSTRVTAGLQTREDALVALGEADPAAKLAKIKAEKEEWAKLMLLEKGQPDQKSENGEDDEGKVESGMGATTGTNTTETDKQRGRPRTTKGE